ncbi:hypothetical protein CLV63_12632 [Murinocardiopsis flavida]|uniref:Uncharacterized protein n=1 Tax=Murinocardiopsis flavida TaxID=645275 RepID=A0A2P8CWT5_9ACTN|nr:hypothetical protein [Murinocardiopsis flavida]PSK89396.1 hypothetical protein CLV63_12632 [Murinocardiopsis flavida]
MISLVFAVFALVHAVLTVWLARIAAVRGSRHAWLAAAVAAGLVYDNGVVALGSTLGEGDLLYALNVPRFVIHALVTPLLIVFAAGAARDHGLAWARPRAVHAGFCLAATALIAYGVLAEVVGLSLVPGREGDALRYSAAETAAPIPSIATVVVLLAVGLLLLVRSRSGWMAAGAALMFAAAAVPSAPLAVGNLGEVALIAGLAMTARRMGRGPSRPPTPGTGPSPQGAHRTGEDDAPPGASSGAAGVPRTAG